MTTPDDYPKIDDGGPNVARLVVGVVIAAAIIIFVAQNTDSMQIKFLVFSFDAPRWIMFVILLGLGVALDRLGTYLWKRHKNKPATK
jgi:hypothetical protein